MGFDSSIEWTTHTFNPWWGCTRASAGCQNCYAEALAKRYGQNVWGPLNSRRLMSEGYWKQPHTWNARAKKMGVRAQVFCASMADVFEDDAPADQRERLWQVIRDTPWLDWQLLTKRPQNIAHMLPSDWQLDSQDGWRNVWLGTSIEDEKVAHRSQVLARIPAHLRFLSVEPLIGPLENLSLEGIAWVIVGGESGPGARPMRSEWATAVMEQCARAEVPCFFKQTGSVLARKLSIKGKGNHLEDLPPALRRREMPPTDVVLHKPDSAQPSLLCA
jgi:protein gp37